MRLNHQTKTNSNPRIFWRLRLSSLLLIVTVCAILFAWLVDHRNLRSQIKQPETKFSAIYSLRYASARRVVSELSLLYPDQRFIEDKSGTMTVVPSPQTQQAVIVSCDASVREQIAIIIRHFDRDDTDMIENETVAEKVEHGKKK